MESSRFGAKFPVTRGDYDEQIARLYREENHSLEEIARLFNSSRRTIRARLEANGIEVTRRGAGEPINAASVRKRAQAYQLYTAGVPLEEIQQRLGLGHPRSVYKLLPDDVPRRYPQRANTRKTASTATTTEGAS